jgi:threonine dehydrogenase-like Zn-dependent dehydrogenase
MKSRAMVLTEPGKMELREFDLVPTPRDHILLKVVATSVCASDPKIFHGKSPFTAFPLIMGHEVTGEVADIAAETASRLNLHPGDRITIEPAIPCGVCHWCRTEHYYHKCRPLRAYGVTMPADEPPFLFGGYSDYMYLLPGTLFYRVAEGVPDRAACMSTVIGNGVRWIKTLAQMTFGQTLVVSGAGSQGLATLIAARECGVGPIVMLGLTKDEARLKLAREYGADFVVDVEKDNPLEAVADLLGGYPDVVVETSGVPAAIKTAIDMVRPIGKVVSIGLSGGKETPIVFDALVAKGVTLLSDHAQAGNMEDAMKIINSRKYGIEKMNNFAYRLEELPQALEDTSHPPADFVKGVITFN